MRAKRIHFQVILFGFALLAHCVFLVSPRAVVAQNRQPVDLELVLAIDTSTSVDPTEFDLQWRGLARAFLHPDVIGAIQAVGDLGIAVTMVQWAGRSSHRTSVEWTFIDDAASAARFSAKIAGAPRMMRGFTDIGGAIRFSAQSIAQNGYEGSRKVIDVSGDGASSTGSPARARDIAVAQGITINGLVIYNEALELDLGKLASISLRQHYRDNVIGGPAAFLMIADDFDDFARAIQEKLVREIMGPPIAGLRLD